MNYTARVEGERDSFKNIDLGVNRWTAGCTSISGQQGEAAAVVDEGDGGGGVGDDEGEAGDFEGDGDGGVGDDED